MSIPGPAAESTQIFPPMALDDFLAHRQADARALIFVASVQTLEDNEDSARRIAGSIPIPLSCTEKIHTRGRAGSYQNESPAPCHYDI